MNPSPKGRWIEKVDGNPEDIQTRGEQIRTLGQQMLDCADTLETIKNQALADGSQQGKAIEKLKESVGDSHDVLRQAGELYEPVGPVIRQYGSSLSIIQPSLDGHVDDCESRWATYQSLPGDAEGSTTPEAGGGFLGMGGHDADSPEAKQEAEDNAAKKEAYEAWLESARAFDINYDSWENAFEEAANGIEDTMADSIKDEFWKDLLGDIGTVLEWAALITGVLALVLAGPFIGIALLVGAALLAVTTVQWLMGDKTLLDVGIAVLGVLPLGKAGKLFTSGGVKAGLKTFGSEAIKPIKEIGGQLRNIKNANAGGNLLTLTPAAYRAGNPNGVADIVPRMFVGKDFEGFKNLESTTIGQVAGTWWDLNHSMVGQGFKYEGWVSTITGNESVKKDYPILDVLW